jgi:hypothetical protein
MKLSIKKFAFTCSILWGIAVFIVSFSNFFLPDYGASFLLVIASIYPGFEAMQGISSIVIGTLYAVVDAFIGGAIFAWLYNLIPE